MNQGGFSLSVIIFLGIGWKMLILRDFRDPPVSFCHMKIFSPDRIDLKVQSFEWKIWFLQRFLQGFVRNWEMVARNI